MRLVRPFELVALAHVRPVSVVGWFGPATAKPPARASRARGVQTLWISIAPKPCGNRGALDAFEAGSASSAA